MAFNGYNNSNKFLDYQRAEDEFQAKKQLAAAQLAQSQAAIQKAQEVDVDKLGERAFMKAAQGLELSPQELAAAKYVDAKSGGIQFDPVNGGMIQRPRISDKIGLPNVLNAPPMLNQPTSQPTAQPRPTPRPITQPMTPENAAATIDIFEPAPPRQIIAAPAPNEWEIAFQKEMAANAGNPKAQQAIRETYSKSKISMNEAEAKAAGFADRMANANPVVEQTQTAGMNPAERLKAQIPLLGNYIVSKDYQSFSQAQRDFINAQLRRESGAVISPAEFDNAEKQYFPVAGDSDQVLAQKKLNRDTAIKGMQRSAGAAYKPNVVATPPKSPKLKKSEADFNAKKIATPEEIAAYKKARGIQ